MSATKLSWFGIVRLGLVQTSLGAIVVLMTSTLNRIMVVELALPAIVPGALVTLHHAMQLLRPRMGHGSDVGRRRTPWIVGGMTALAIGGIGAASATSLMLSHFALGMMLAVLAFALIGVGVSACGTSLLVLLAERVADSRKAAAATTVWMMMIAGFAITATVAGKLLDPFSPARLIAVASGVSLVALVVAVAAVAGIEGRRDAAELTAAAAVEVAASAPKRDFRSALREVWSDANARRFTVFVFVSMLAYSAQDLILEPFAGSVFHFSPGESTSLSGAQHGGTFAGMLLVAVVTSTFKGTPAASLKGWVIGGCLASGLAMSGLVLAGLSGGAWPLRENVFVLGLANGVFSIAAIGSMMTLAGQGRGGRARQGIRMGLWGAAQAIAFGTGGFFGTALVDLVKEVTGSSGGGSYAFVFAVEAVGFFAALWVAQLTTFSTSVDEGSVGVEVGELGA
jgi:BCD family chlorophyll transporter-like MFS transporter